MNVTVDKSELIAWLRELEDQSILETIQLLKESTRPVSWDDLPEAAKASVERGLEDSKAGRVHTSEEFWKEISRRRKNRA